MGLDNGLILHTKELIEIPKEIDGFIALEPVSLINAVFPYHYELCYYRKCWNLRREIGRAINAESVEYVSKPWLTISDVKNIWHAINEINSKRIWESGDTIWTWREIKPILDRDLLVIEWLISYMRTHDSSTYMVEFYDSY